MTIPFRRNFLSVVPQVESTPVRADLPVPTFFFIQKETVLAVLERQRKTPQIRAKALARPVVDRFLETKICL